MIPKLRNLLKRSRGRPKQEPEIKEPKKIGRPRRIGTPPPRIVDKEWFNEYYINKVVDICRCPVCNTEFTTKIALRYHEKKQYQMQTHKITKTTRFIKS